MIKLLESFLLPSEPRATATNSPTLCKLQIETTPLCNLMETWTNVIESRDISYHFSATESFSIWTNVVKTRRATATVRARGDRARRSAACSAASWGSCASPSAAPWPTRAGAPAPRGPGELWLVSTAWNEGYPNVPEEFTITEKAPTRAFSWLKAPTSAFTFKTLLRHYAKRALTPR